MATLKGCPALIDGHGQASGAEAQKLFAPANGGVETPPFQTTAGALRPALRDSGQADVVDGTALRPALRDSLRRRSGSPTGQADDPGVDLP